MLKASKIRQSHETEPPKPRGQATAPPRGPASGSRDCRQHRENPLPSRATETDTERVRRARAADGPPTDPRCPAPCFGASAAPAFAAFLPCLSGHQGQEARGPRARNPPPAAPQRLRAFRRGTAPPESTTPSLLGSRAAMSGFPRVLVRPEGFLRTDLAVVIRMWPLSWPPPDTGKGVRSKPSRRERTHPPASAPWARGLKTLQLQMVLHQAAEKN